MRLHPDRFEKKNALQTEAPVKNEPQSQVKTEMIKPEPIKVDEFADMEEDFDM